MFIYIGRDIDGYKAGVHEVSEKEAKRLKAGYGFTRIVENPGVAGMPKNDEEVGNGTNVVSTNNIPNNSAGKSQKSKKKK